MRTGNFRIEALVAQKGLFGTQRLQVLMVEVEEPVDGAGTFAKFWKPASDNDRMAYEHQQKELRCRKELAEDQIERLRGRLDAIAEVAAHA